MILAKVIVTISPSMVTKETVCAAELYDNYLVSLHFK